MVLMNMYIEDSSKSLTSHIEDFFNEKKQKSNNTFVSYASDISMILSDLFRHNSYYDLTLEELESLNVNILKMYQNELYNKVNDNNERVYSNGTINRRFASFRSFISYLADYGVIDANLKLMSQVKLIKNLPDDSEEGEMIPVEEAIRYSNFFRYKEKFQGLEKHLVVLLGLETALRINELLNLEWSQFHVDGEEVVIKSKGKIKGKGNKEYTDKISIEFYNELLQLKELGNTNKLFTTKYNTMVNAMNRANEYFNNVGKGYTCHSFKRTAVTMVYRATGCIIAAQKKARHSDVKTTMRYLKIEDVGVTGVISGLRTIKEDEYKKTDLETLISCIEELPVDVKLLLNKKLMTKRLNKII